MQLYDYYKILQVHNIAEPEIIESAYKRLVKKYHPDANPNGNSLEMMQMINEAYAVLSDREKRKQYNIEWDKIHNKQDKNIQNNSSAASPYQSNERMFVMAKNLLEDYFKNIKNKNFNYCYELVSEIDKHNISKEEFVSWQEAVSKIYEIKEFCCEFYGVYRNKLIKNTVLAEVVEFNIHTVEYNTVMEMNQKDHITKMVILDKGEWKVYIGYEKLQPIISKLNDLNGVLNAKSVLNELMAQQIKNDIVTGLYNQRGILENIEREINRYDRYGNYFSLILCEIELVKLVSPKEEKEVIDNVVKGIANLLSNQLRKLDIIGRWSENSIMIVLPETGFIPAIKVSHKIKKLLKDHQIILNDKDYKIITDFGIAEYSSSMEETLDRIYHQLR